MSQRQGKLFNCTNRDLPLSARAVPGQVGRLVFISLHRRVVTWHRVTNQDTHSFIDAGASAVGCSAFPYMSNYASMQCFPANRVILDGSKSISGLFFLRSPYGGVVLPSNETHGDFISFHAVEEPLKTTFQVLICRALIVSRAPHP
jgi:hypothetical protein